MCKIHNCLPMPYIPSIVSIFSKQFRKNKVTCKYMFLRDCAMSLQREIFIFKQFFFLSVECFLQLLAIVGDFFSLIVLKLLLYWRTLVKIWMLKGIFKLILFLGYKLIRSACLHWNLVFWKFTTSTRGLSHKHHLLDNVRNIKFISGVTKRQNDDYALVKILFFLFLNFFFFLSCTSAIEYLGLHGNLVMCWNISMYDVHREK